MKQYRLAVALTPSFINILAFEKKGQSYSLKSQYSFERSSSSLEEFKEIFTAWYEKNIAKNSKVEAVLSIPESFTFLRQFDIPQARQKEFAEALFWEVSARASDLPRESVIQWQALDKKSQLVKTAVVAIKQSDSDKLYDIFSDLSIELLAIEPSTTSLVRLFPGLAKNIHCFVYLDRNEPSLTITRKGVPVFSSTLDISLGEEKDAGISEKKAKELAESVVKLISFWQKEDEEKIVSLKCLGEPKLFSKLKKSLQAETKLPVDDLTVKAGLKSARKIKLSDGLEDTFAVNLGALSRLFAPEADQEINLLPELYRKELQKEAKKELINKRLIHLSMLHLGIAAVIILLIFAFQIWENILQAKISQAKQFIDNHPARPLVAKVNSLNKLAKTQKELFALHNDAGERLKMIAFNTPETIGFQKVASTSSPDEKWEISGSGDRKDILAFYKKLAKELNQSQVVLTYSSLQKDKDVNYLIRIVWQH